MEEEIKRVIKRPMSQRVLNAIFRGEDYKTFGKSLWEEQILPMMGDTLEEIISRAIHVIFYKDDFYEPRNKKKKGRNSRHDYTAHSKKTRNRDRERIDEDDDIPSDLGPRDMHRVPLKDLKEVEYIISYLANKIADDGEASVHDFYQELNIGSTNFKNMDFGWTDTKDIYRARKKKLNGSYYLEFPKPEKLPDIDDRDLDDDDEEDDDE